MSLTVTSNEHLGKIARVRDRVPDLQVSRKPLPAGDYCFDANGLLIGIEVKWSMSDLLDSLQVRGENGGPRLQVEVRKLIQVCDMAFLVTPPIRSRGDGKVLRDDGQVSGWEYNSVKGILTDCQMAGVLVDEWEGDIAQRIAQLYYVISQKEHGWIKQRGRPEFVSLNPNYTHAVWALCAFDHWGPVTAQEALKGRSVADLAAMSEKNLTKIAGVGPKGAKALYEGMHGRW